MENMQIPRFKQFLFAIVAFVVLLHTCYSLAPSNVTMFTSPMTWNEAQRFCRSIGQSLVTIESLDKQTAIEFFLNQQPWKKIKSKEFWIGLHSPSPTNPLEFQWEETCQNPSLFRWGHMEPLRKSLHYCVYALLDRGYLKWHTEQCYIERKFFMCEKQLEECTYDVKSHTWGNSKISTDVTNTDREQCMDRCLTFTSAGGLPCWGFNFDKGNNACSLLATNDAYRLDTQNSVSLRYDLFIKRCQIKPQMDGTAYGSVKEKMCTEHPVGKCSGIDGACQLTTVTMTTDPVPTSPQCQCRTTRAVNVSNLDARIQEIVREMKIDRKLTSLARRKLISVDDKRPTSKGIGYVAIAFMTVVFGGLVLMDLGLLVEHARRAIRRLAY